ncbi:fructokinase [Thraustotheca clavata]|uniref:Fructokinase n=1 Tax=Thraustotheca clavata TaxID=74557 RepID=A0A1W0A990_9STRA|nr:fructokinase [Thraustotheca clavata]
MDMVWPSSMFLRRAHSTSAFDLISCGSSLVNVISHVKKLPLPNSMVFNHKKTTQNEIVTGGALHHSAWVQVLGVNSSLLSLQGADKYGDMIRETMRKHNISTDFMVQKDEFESSVCRTFVDSMGEKCSIMSAGSMMDLPNNAMKLFFSEPIQKAKSISLDINQVPLASIEEMLDVALGAGSLRFLDITLLPSVAVHEAELGDWDTLERCISKSTVVKASLAAAKELTNDPSAPIDEIAIRMREKFQIPYVAITDGANGAVIAYKLAGGKSFSAKIPLPSNISFADDSGAEDAFFGGLIAGFHHWGIPEDVDSALRIGSLAGATRAACCETIGSLPTDESFFRVQKFIPLAFHPVAKRLSVDQETVLRAIEGPNASLTRDIDALLHMRRLFTNLEYATQFQAFVSRIVQCRENRNRVYLSGIGKSGIVARRFASTLSSLSIPSQWIHGSEWTHGELGNLFPGDVVILISNSGKTPELLHLPDVFREFEVDVLCLVGNEDSPLFKSSDFPIYTPAEDWLFDSVPTRSIVTQESVCNAVAESVVALTGIKRCTFKKNHPGGNIGKVFLRSRTQSTSSTT